MAGTKKTPKATEKPKANMNNTSRFDDDGFGIRNFKKPGDNKKKTTARKK